MIGDIRATGPRTTTLGWISTLAIVTVLTTPSVSTARSISFSSNNFEQIAYRRGVAVFKHRRDSRIHVGAIGRIDASPARVLETLLSYDQHAGRLPRLRESRVMSRDTRGLSVYQRLDLPVINDRDFTLAVRWGKRGEARWIDYSAVANSGPAKRSGVVRVTHHTGGWALSPSRDGKATWARFVVQIDMAGWLPLWMARTGAGKDLPKMFEAVRRMVAQRLNSPPKTMANR